MLDSSLEALTKTALLGTARDSAAPILSGALAPFAAAQESAESTLLNAAAAATLGAKAGALPAQNTAPGIVVCPPETQPYFSPRGAQLIGWVLNDFKDFLPEALELAARSGQIAPPPLLIPLLEQGRASKEMRRIVAPVLGERGRWLAQLNADWKNVAAPLSEDLEKSWNEGESVARREALRLQREINPAVARGWLEAVFKSEAARERAEFIAILAEGLSPDDEAFLESALDDKSKEVRQAALLQLQELPDSQLVQRAKNELASLLRWTPKGIEVTLPPWNKVWARDGLEEKAPPLRGNKKLGEKATWVNAFLMRVPPSHWEKEWNATPAQIVAAAPKEWRELLHGGWWNAARHWDALPWLEAILDAVGYKTIEQWWGLSGLAPEIADRLTVRVWQQKESNGITFVQWAQLLSGHGGAWSRELSRCYLSAVQEFLRGEVAKENKAKNATYGQHYWIVHSLPAHAEFFAVELVEEATQGWPEDHENWDAWRSPVEKFKLRLQVRADLHKEFCKATP